MDDLGRIAPPPTSRANDTPVVRWHPKGGSFLWLRANFDASTVDGLLLELADAGAEPGSIAMSSVPRRGRHGNHVVTWRQDGRNRSEEGSFLEVALRRAVRAAGGRCADPDPSPPHGSAEDRA